MSDRQPVSILSNKQQRAQNRRSKLHSYGTRAERKQYAIEHNLTRPPSRPKNHAHTQHQRDRNNLTQKIANAHAAYKADSSTENHNNLMNEVEKLANVVHQDDLHPATHKSTEHLPPRSGKNIEQRRRAEERRLHFLAYPLNPEERAAKAAASKARREAMGIVDRVKGQSNKEYKLQRAAARLARDEEEEADSLVGSTPGNTYFNQMKKQEAERKRMFEKLPGQKDLEWSSQHRGVPSEYAIN